MMAGQWEGGAEQRFPRWVLMLVGAATVAIAGSLLSTGSPTSPSPSLQIDIDTVREPEEQRPAPVTDVSFVRSMADSPCPSARPVVVIGRLAYPPTFPDVPPGDADSCYARLDSAVADGFRVPRPQPGVAAIDGLYLGPLPGLDDSCREAARRLGFSVPCPLRLPHGGRLSICTVTCAEAGAYILRLRDFPRAQGWCARCAADLVIAATPEEATGGSAAVTRCQPSDAAADRPWLVSRCLPQAGPAPDGPHAGHILLRGSTSGVSFAVSVEGYGGQERRLVDSIVDTIVFVAA